MAHGKSLFIALLLILTFTAVPSFAAEDSVDIPAEYYFGRWARGQYGTVNGILWNNRSPVWKSGYGSANNAVRIEIPQFAHDGLWDSRGDDYRIAPTSLWWRPGSRWQIGVTGLFYKYSWDLQYSGASQAEARRTEYYSLGFDVPLDFVSADTFYLDQAHALYSYYIVDFLPAGRFHLRSRSSLQVYRRHATHLSNEVTRSGEFRQYSYALDDYSTLFPTSTNATIGLTPRTNLLARLAVLFRRNIYDNLTGRLDENLVYVIDHSWARHIQYGIRCEVGVRARVAHALWLRAGLLEEYIHLRDWYRNEEFLDGRHLSVDVTEQTSWRDPYASVLHLGLDYLTFNGFHSAALLDDYQDYYGHLLSERQWLISLDLVARWMEYDQDRFSLSYLIRNGWSDHFEVGLSGGFFVQSYSDDLIQRQLTMRLQVRWRTYRYEPGKGPGWERDSRYDVAFGSIPRAGHWFGTFNTSVFSAADHGAVDAGFFAFWDLNYDIGFEQYSLTHRLGLGRQIALEATQAIRFAGKSLSKLHIDRHYYTVGAVARPLPMIQVGVNLKDAFYYYGNSNQPAEWNVTLRGLL